VAVVAAAVGLVIGVLATQGGAPAGAAAPYYDASAREGSVYRLYRAYFQREPDQSGFGYWYLQSVRGTSLATISETFARSSEFRRRYGNVDNRRFVELVYQNVLGRKPDAAGSSYWINQMNRGASRGSVMIAFSNSGEYRRTTNLGLPPGFRAGSNARAMLDALTVAAEPTRTGYDRGLFKHWDDENRNGCDTRCEVLRAERRANGTWFSLWDGYTASSASELEVDHVVALAEAWDSGANTWSAARRDAFADWQVNLTAVTEASNQRKGDKDAAQWFPSRAASNCAFAEITITTKRHWALKVDPAEKTALANMLRNCSASSSTPPAAPSPTTTRPTPSGCRSAATYTARNGACVADYEDSSGDVDCGQLPAAMKPVTVKTPGVDPYGLDGDRDGIGCEGG
jgi:hypothetical protein